jgi:hypothetical protein
MTFGDETQGSFSLQRSWLAGLRFPSSSRGGQLVLCMFPSRLPRLAPPRPDCSAPLPRPARAPAGSARWSILRHNRPARPSKRPCSSDRLETLETGTRQGLFASSGCRPCPGGRVLGGAWRTKQIGVVSNPMLCPGCGALGWRPLKITQRSGQVLGLLDNLTGRPLPLGGTMGSRARREHGRAPAESLSAVASRTRRR